MYLNVRKFEHVEMRIIRQNIRNIQTTCNIYVISKRISRFNFVLLYISKDTNIDSFFNNCTILR